MSKEKGNIYMPVERQLTTPQPLKPHRSGAILALGILGILVCFICGIIAWVMGNNDLREMDAGIMDPSGRGMTQAGKICGIVSTLLWLAGMLITILVFAFITIVSVAATTR